MEIQFYNTEVISLNGVDRTIGQLQIDGFDFGFEDRFLTDYVSTHDGRFVCAIKCGMTHNPADTSSSPEAVWSEIVCVFDRKSRTTNESHEFFDSQLKIEGIRLVKSEQDSFLSRLRSRLFSFSGAEYELRYSHLNKSKKLRLFKSLWLPEVSTNVKAWENEKTKIYPWNINQPSETLFGNELAEKVALVLDSGRELSYSHKDYCGMGLKFDQNNQKYVYGPLSDGEFLMTQETIKQWGLRSEFVSWLATQSDASLSRKEDNDNWYYCNQTITTQRLVEFVGG